MKKNALEISAIVITGIAAGVVLSHVLQAGPKAALSAEEYLTVQQTLYQNYRNTIGVVETLGLIVLGIIAWSDRRNRNLRTPSFVAFACLLIMFAIWAIGLNPINLAVSSWTLSTMPANWTDMRDRWHWLHEVRAILAFISLMAVSYRIVLRTRSVTVSVRAA